MLNLNPVLKRFLKVLLVGAAVGGLNALLGFLPNVTFLSAGELALASAVILAIEKALPTNL